jgi:hypothetical protein
VLLRFVYTTQLTWHRSQAFSGSTEYDETAREAEMYLDKTSIGFEGVIILLLRIVYTFQLTWHRPTAFSGSTESDETARVAEMYLDKTSASDFRQ